MATWRLIPTHEAPVTWLSKQCCTCFTGPESRDLWVDAGIETDDGALLFCLPCAVEIAPALGLVTSDGVDELLCRALAAEAEVSNLIEELAEAEQLLSALRRYDAAHPAPVADTGSVPSSPDSVDSIDDRLADVDAVLDDLAEAPVVPQRPRQNRSPRR